MNVCSVLITSLDYLNPPSELRPVTRIEGSERSKLKVPPPPHFSPKITVSSLGCTLLLLLLSSLLTPIFILHFHPHTLSLFIHHSFWSVALCSSVSTSTSTPLQKDEGFLSLAGPMVRVLLALPQHCVVCRHHLEGTSLQMSLEQDGNYKLRFLKSILFFPSIWKGIRCKCRRKKICWFFCIFQSNTLPLKVFSWQQC